MKTLTIHNSETGSASREATQSKLSSRSSGVKMAKKATKSQSSSASSPSNQRMVLRKRQTVVRGEKERSASSAKKLSVKHKKKYDKFEAKKPKKPPTAFFYFLEDFRKEFQEQNPDVKSMRDIGKACGEKWKTMTYEEKVQYYDIATEKRAEFDRAMADYIKRKESGEGLETEDDSELDEYA